MLVRIPGIMLVMLLAAACASPQAVAPTETATPDVPTEVPTEAPTRAPLVRNTLPPTWTDVPAGVTVAAVETDADAPPPSVTATRDPSIPTPVEPTYSPSCDLFGPDLSRLNRRFTPGSDVSVYWIPAAEAQFYRVALLDDENVEVFADLVEESSYTFAADLFEPGRLYFWEAHPVNPLGQQFCQKRGSELVPEDFIGG